MGGRGTTQTGFATAVGTAQAGGDGAVTMTAGGFSVEGYDREAQVLMRQMFGKTISAQEMGEMVGAWSGLKLQVTVKDGRVELSGTHKYLIKEEGFIRTFGKDATGKTYIENESFYLNGGTGRTAPAGFGARVFANQVKAAQSGKVEYIKTYALRNDSTKRLSVGYNVWAKLGYNGKLSNRVKGEWTRLNPMAKYTGAKQPRTIHELMKTAGGRRIWERFGESQTMVFGLGRGSASVRVLKDYFKAKGLKF
jgi:hypothetical protein